MKSGTSSLHSYLSAHPQIFMPAVKEVNFFRGAKDFAKGLDWYSDQFSAAKPGQLLGEASPDYTKHPHHEGAPQRVKDTCPDAKLIFIAREPVERMRSMYLHPVSEGHDERTVDEALLNDEHYFEVSQYASQLDHWLALFPREQLLILASESLARDRDATIKKVHAFLGVEHVCVEVEAEVNRSADRRQKSKLLRRVTDNHRLLMLTKKLPAPVRKAVARKLSKPMPVDNTRPSLDTIRVLNERLAPDIDRFAELAPDVVAAWRSPAP